MTSHNNAHQSLGRWIEYYARVGYGAKGVIYATVGLLALFEALDLNSGKTVGSEGMLQEVVTLPFGRLLLGILMVSLVGYVTWRFVQAIFDPEHSGCDLSDIVRRISYACSGVAYSGVAFSAFKILIPAVGNGREKTPEDWAVQLMRQPFGRWLLAAVGFTILGIGCYYFYRSYKAAFRKRFKLHHMSDTEKTWATLVGRVGIAARGVVYAVIGCYAIRAAWEFEPDMIKTTEDALAVFENNPTDEWILAILGMGFIAYGTHMAFQSRYRSIDPIA